MIVLITEIVRYHGSYAITRSLITYKFKNATSDWVSGFSPLVFRWLFRGFLHLSCNSSLSWKHVCAASSDSAAWTLVFFFKSPPGDSSVQPELKACYTLNIKQLFQLFEESFPSDYSCPFHWIVSQSFIRNVILIFLS